MKGILSRPGSLSREIYSTTWSVILLLLASTFSNVEVECSSDGIDFNCTFKNTISECHAHTQEVAPVLCYSAEEWGRFVTEIANISPGDGSIIELPSTTQIESHKRFMCISYFEWDKGIDEDADELTTRYLEVHRCIYDSPEHIADRSWKLGGCVSYNKTDSYKMYLESICLCDNEDNCNDRFYPGFNEPSDARHLCGTMDLQIDNTRYHSHHDHSESKGWRNVVTKFPFVTIILLSIKSHIL